MEVGRGCCGALEAVPGCGGDRVMSAPHVTGAGCMAHGDLADAGGYRMNNVCFLRVISFGCVGKEK